MCSIRAKYAQNKNTWTRLGTNPFPISHKMSKQIKRRILRKNAANEHDQLGDTTTLADPSVVKSLVENRKNT